jgi:asparagine synthase (glutamine-hydrolysing)
MCGIAGFVQPDCNLSRPELEATALEMAATLHHRGPDDQGAWADAQAGVSLGHRRLAILDLSAEGHQPMCSADGRYVLVYNGEIYNFLDLRTQLEKQGRVFRGHCDTEVMLAAFTQWGIEPAVKRFLGMFAFALWDRSEHRLHLARDRAGEKPLYYGWSGGVFLFGSELKALRAHPQWQAELDQEALTLFMRHSYIPAPHSIYQNIFKLTPGCTLTLSARQLENREVPAPEAYWSLQSVAEAGVAHPFPGDVRQAVEHLTRLLSESVALQMVADVPIGAFLSGGIDSSMIVALMQAQSPRPIKTFSIGFADEEYDEAPFAKKIAQYLGTQHTEMYVHPGTLQRALPHLPAVYDEPLADTSHVPTALLCQLARKQVTVCLSGDAGDELFGGYDQYRRTQNVWDLIRKVPVARRQGLALLLKRAATAGADMQNGLGSEPRLWKRLLRLSELLPVSNDQALYQLLISPCRDPQNWLRSGDGDGLSGEWNFLPKLLQRMM